MNKHETYMRMAIELAVRGWGKTSPNPLVGALVVKNGKICGEGFHAGPGLPHAEINAIKDAGKKARGAELIVNLEPCCHYGRTPPCTKAIIESGIKKVIYGMKDPNPLVSGKGLKELRKVGITVVGPVFEKECRSINRIYINWLKGSLPYVIAKVALSLDGKIAAMGGDSKWITGEDCRHRMHYWRAGVDAVMVGAETVRKDDPLLDARNVGCSKQPRPVIISSSGNFDLKKRIWKRRPLVFCTEQADIAKLERVGAEVVLLKGSKKQIDVKKILQELRNRNITSILVEGGASLHSQMFAGRYVNYMVASISTKMIGALGKEWLAGWKVRKIEMAPRIEPDRIVVLGNDVVVEGEIDYGKR